MTIIRVSNDNDGLFFVVVKFTRIVRAIFYSPKVLGGKVAGKGIRLPVPRDYDAYKVRQYYYLQTVLRIIHDNIAAAVVSRVINI